jgi:heme/copper-type cytochrome/quinol oxidase subunit 2
VLLRTIIIKELLIMGVVMNMLFVIAIIVVILILWVCLCLMVYRTGENHYPDIKDLGKIKGFS